MIEGEAGNNIHAVEEISFVVPELVGGGGEEGMESTGYLSSVAISGDLRASPAFSGTKSSLC